MPGALSGGLSDIRADFDLHRGGGGPGGGRRGRMFDGGDYSPGTIYPTLRLLEDLGLIQAVSQDGGRRQYALTPEGAAHLAAQADALARIETSLTLTRDQARARSVPDIRRAMENLKTALRLRFDAGTPPDADTVRRIADAIDRAAADIGRL